MQTIDEATSVLRYRRALTGQRWNGDEEAGAWLDLLAPFEADTVRAAVAFLARLEPRVHLRDVLARLDPAPAARPEQLGSLGDVGCYECDGCGFSADDDDPTRLAPCSRCQPERRAAVNARGAAIRRAEALRQAAVNRDVIDPQQGWAVGAARRAEERARIAAARDVELPADQPSPLL